MSVFSERLKQVLSERKLKQTELARAVGVARSTINKYLKSADKSHEADIVLAIARALDVSSEWLYGATDIRKPFYEPSIVELYEKLSGAGKKALSDYAQYLLQREGDNNENR